jgi:hypothetical protein
MRHLHRLSTPVFQFYQFWQDERGAVYPTASFLMSTLVLAIPFGFLLWSIYDSLVESGRTANFILGTF